MMIHAAATRMRSRRSSPREQRTVVPRCLRQKKPVRRNQRPPRHAGHGALHEHTPAAEPQKRSAEDRAENAILPRLRREGPGRIGNDAEQGLLPAAGEPKQIWEVPNGQHIAGITTKPAEYERRVIGFFDPSRRPPPECAPRRLLRCRARRDGVGARRIWSGSWRSTSPTTTSCSRTPEHRPATTWPADSFRWPSSLSPRFYRVGGARAGLALTLGAIGITFGVPGAYYLLDGSASGDHSQGVRDHPRGRPAAQRTGDALAGPARRRAGGGGGTSGGG